MLFRSIAPAVEKLLAAQNARDAELAALKKQLFAARAQALPVVDRHVVTFEKHLTPQDLRTLAVEISELGTSTAAAVLSETAPGTWSYVLYGPADKMREMSRQLNHQLNGRGGGSGCFVQGAYKADEGAVRAALEAAFSAL